MPQLVAEEVARFLKQTSLFAILNDESVDRMANRTTMYRFSLGETIIEEGDDGRFAWLIFSGRVRVLKRSDSGRQVTLGSQTVGEIFGEQSILTDSPRSASVRAAEEVVLFRIDRMDFLDLLDSSQNLRQYFDQFIHERAVRDFLRTQTFLEKLRARDVISLLDQLQPREFSAGEVVIREGTAADVMYIVREGRLKVVREAGKNEVLLGYLSDGDFFGERALLTDESRSASVVAETPTRCFALSRQHFDGLLETSPAIRKQLTERFSRYDASNDLLVSPRDLPHSRPVEKDRAEPTPQGDATRELDSQTSSQNELNKAPISYGQRYQKMRSGPRWFEPLPWIAQQDESDCGAASLAMVARYFGICIPVERLRRLAHTGYAGASLYFLAAAAAQIGFRPRATRSTVKQIVETQLPAIAHWDNRHFIVLYRVNSGADEFVIGDPERGLLKLTRQQFENGWSGKLLKLEPTPRLEEHPQPDSMLKRLFTSIQNRIPGAVSHRDIKGLVQESEKSERLNNKLPVNIRLESVSYQFSTDGLNTLSEINLDVQAGQTVAIVGRSGAGKSLLAAVLQGSLIPTSGRIQVNGKTQHPENSLRPLYNSQLLQERDVFDGLTIAENISLNSSIEPTDRNMIAAAAELVEADPFINRLPYGYDTPIGNGFAQLSAGEGQLLSLARASLMDAPLLVMDDSLSALPSAQARRILLRLRNFTSADEGHGPAHERTFIVTSRNIATIRDADLIAVLDDGHLVESGKHNDLIARDGLYKFLWQERSLQMT